MADGDHLGAAAGQRPELVPLEAQVHGHDPGSAEAAQPAALAHPSLQLGGSASSQLTHGSVWETSATRSRSLTQGALRASSTCASGVSAEARAITPRRVPRSRRWRVSARVSTPRSPGTPWRRSSSSSERSAGAVPDPLRELPDDERPAVHPAGLGVVVTHPVVADQWVGHDHHLAGVGGVGADLLVTGHAGVEDDLAGGGGSERRPEQPPFVDHPGFESEPTPRHARSQHPRGPARAGAAGRGGPARRPPGS